MEQSSTTTSSGGGAVFAGDITAGRDVVINHFTEIRQVTEHLYNQCSAVAGGLDDLLVRLDNLQWIAGIVEEDAKELQTDIPVQDPQLQRVYRECILVLSEVQEIATLVQDCSSGTADALRCIELPLEEKLDKARARLMTLQMKLSHIRNKRIAKDVDIIKAAVVELLDGPGETDDKSSIRTFYTASSIPYVERQTWRELEQSLRARFSAQFLRDNFALIVSTVEETIWDYTLIEPTTSLEPSSNALANQPISAPPNFTTTGNSVEELTQKHENLTLQHEATDSSLILVDSVIGESTSVPRYDASHQFQIRGPRASNPSVVGIYDKVIDKTGKSWAESVDMLEHERLLTFDGGGVKSYSSVLIVERLMHEVARYEERFEDEFTHYPRCFDALGLRPCHYFDKMYGTSTGGIIAIALSRLRMSVTETIDNFRELLAAMYGSPRLNPLPLSTKYNHEAFVDFLKMTVGTYNKDRSSGSGFLWPAVGNNEDALCQTICLTATHMGNFYEPYLLRSFVHEYNPEVSPPWTHIYNEGGTNLKIWQVARATTAAPFYFDMLFAHTDKDEGSIGFKDGGIRENNPSFCAYSEHATSCGDDAEPSILLSIGSGQNESSRDAFRTVWPGPFGSLSAVQRYSQKLAVFKNVLIKDLEGHDRHKMMRTIARGEHRWYKRLNVNRGLEGIKIDQWESGFDVTGTMSIRGAKTMIEIERATDLYLKRDHVDRIGGYEEYQPPKVMIEQIAEKLVRARRARELDAMMAGGEKRERWEAYMGKHLPGEERFFRTYLAQWDYAMLGRK